MDEQYGIGAQGNDAAYNDYDQLYPGAPITGNPTYPGAPVTNNPAYPSVPQTPQQMPYTASSPNDLSGFNTTVGDYGATNQTPYPGIPSGYPGTSQSFDPSVAGIPVNSYANDPTTAYQYPQMMPGVVQQQGNYDWSTSQTPIEPAPKNSGSGGYKIATIILSIAVVALGVLELFQIGMFDSLMGSDTPTESTSVSSESSDIETDSASKSSSNSSNAGSADKSSIETEKSESSSAGSQDSSTVNINNLKQGDEVSIIGQVAASKLENGNSILVQVIPPEGRTIVYHCQLLEEDIAEAEGLKLLDVVKVKGYFLSKADLQQENTAIMVTLYDCELI